MVKSLGAVTSPENIAGPLAVRLCIFMPLQVKSSDMTKEPVSSMTSSPMSIFPFTISWSDRVTWEEMMKLLTLKSPLTVTLSEIVVLAVIWQDWASTAPLKVMPPEYVCMASILMVFSLPEYGMISCVADERAVQSDMLGYCRSGHWPVKVFAHFGVIYFHFAVVTQFRVIYFHLAHDVLMYRCAGLEQVAKRSKLRGG